jgi:peptidoglycan/xylan/chitin deacetylase (PgdA/CDA1 family)
MKDKIKARLSKIKFGLGLSPIIEKSSDFRKFIAEPYSSAVLISADFELAWAWRYAKRFENAFYGVLQMARQERENLPGILALCEQYNIPITWATVGHLFLESCEKKNGVAHFDIPRLGNFENEYWKFSGKDWYEYDSCTNLETDPEWYCPDLIKLIQASKVNHEIACHTFSHIDCRDSICSPSVMRAELRKCKELAEGFGVQLASFVHPGHTIGNLDVLKEEGFTNFRTDYRNVLGYPKKHSNGLWELEQTAEFHLRKEWSADYHAFRYIEMVKRSMETNTLCVFWFHPSLDPVFIHEIWPQVFSYLNSVRDKVWITTHEEYINFLNR